MNIVGLSKKESDLPPWLNALDCSKAVKKCLNGNKQQRFQIDTCKKCIKEIIQIYFFYVSACMCMCVKKINVQKFQYMF